VPGVPESPGASKKGGAPRRPYVSAASAGDVFTSEHEQLQLSYLVDTGDTWSAEVTAYRNDFERNWYKLQSVNGAGMSTESGIPDFRSPGSRCRDGSAWAS